MNILISQRHLLNQYGDWTDSLENNYIRYFETYNINLIPVSNVTNNIDRLVDDLRPDGIILTGGDDINPELYGGSQNTTAHISRDRDRTEMALITVATKKNIPLLGICRGMQMINVYFNGRLLHNIATIDRQKKHTTPCIHNVKILSKELVRLFGNKTELEVNSYHNLGIITEMLGKDINVFAHYKDLDLIEGIFHKNYPIAGIEWHPERGKPTDELDKILVEAFLDKKIFWETR